MLSATFPSRCSRRGVVVSQALEDVRRNAEYYASQIAFSRKRLAAALEKHRSERERLETQLASDIARAEDYNAILEAAEAALAKNE